MTIEFKKTSTVQTYDTTKLLAHDSIVRSDGSEEDTWRDATPSDLVAALAAMGEGERAEVLGSALPDERVARREWVDETRVIIRALPTESIQDAARRVVRERDEGRKELDRVRASLDVVRHDLDGTRQELREAREDRDSLRARLIAAESAAAAREPREYPLAEGSPPPSIDPERLDLVRRALSGYVDPDQSPEQAARVAVEVADAALAIMRGLV